MNQFFLKRKRTTTLIFTSIMLATQTKQAFSMEIEFRDPKDSKLTTITYTDNAADVSDFRKGGAPLVIWRNNYLRQSNMMDCQKKIEGQLAALSRAAERNDLTQIVAPHNTDDKNLRHYLQMLALLSWGTPDDKMDYEFGVALHKVMTHAMRAAHTPVQNRLTETQKELDKTVKDSEKYRNYFVEYYEKYKDAEKQIKTLNEQNQTKSAEVVAQLKALREELAASKKELEKNSGEKEALRNEIAQRSEKAAQEYQAVYSRISPLRQRAEQAERHNDEKDDKIEVLTQRLRELSSTQETNAIDA